MSADNWARCPFCVKAARLADEAKRQEVADAYGSVSASEYESMRAALPLEFDPEDVDSTLREDYEVGFGGGSDEDPEGLLKYSAHCDRCGARAEVRSTVTLSRGVDRD